MVFYINNLYNKSMLTKRIIRGIANIGDYIESEHIRYWKLFHFTNAKKLNELTTKAPVTRLEKSEVETRILKILYDSELADIKDFAFSMDIHSLSITVLISSIQQEFSTIFDEDVYEDCKTLGEVVDILIQDQNIA